MRLGDKAKQRATGWSLGPPYLRRLAWQSAALTLGLAFASMAIMVYRVHFGMRYVDWIAWLQLGLALASPVAFHVFQAWSRRTLQRRLDAASGRLCIHCAYDLSALGDPGRCPECGNAYVLVQSARAWHAAGFVVSHDTRPI